MNQAKKHSDISYMSIEELSNAYVDGSLSPVEATRHFLDRSKRLNETLNAIYYIDEEGAMAQATASEKRYRDGTPLGYLDGMPTTIKDALAVKGMPTFRGSASTSDAGFFYDWNAPVVDRLKESGSIILGKNTMCDFGIIASGISSRHGITRNPWNVDRTPGASSSGAAASVAAGLCPAALGTDIVGSIRVPASFCGLVGFKPSYGRVPYYLPNSPALVAGPIARTVRDVAIMLDVVSKADRRDFTALKPENNNTLSKLEQVPKSLKMRLLIDIGFGLPPNAEVIEAVQRAARLFEKAGAIVEERTGPVFERDAANCAELFYRARTYTELNTASKEIQMRTPVIYEWTRATAHESAEDLFKAIHQMTSLRERAMQLMENVDFLLLPSTPTTAFAANLATPANSGIFDPWCNTFLFNLTEQPAMSINCGFSAEGLPIGLQIVGKRFDDLGVLRIGRFFEYLYETFSNGDRPRPHFL
jgi:aspartyl-tRNA(Asn)/glutamyl-tRNA(Gln) amidotransferase subunit A